MKFSANYDYPVEPSDLFDLFCDPEFLEAKYASLGHTQMEVTLTEGAAGAVAVVVRRVMTLNVPGFAKRVLKAENTITQTEVWSASTEQGERSAEWTGETAGVPISVSGTMRIIPTEAGCTHVVSGTVTSSIPLIGGKVADFAGGQAEGQIRAEAEFTQAWIDENFV